jgi:L-fucose isomerase-like protein
MEKILITFFSPISDINKNQELRDKCEKGEWMTKLPSEAKEIFQDPEDNTLWLFIGTGGTEKSVIDFLSNYSTKIIPLIVTHDHYNSLPAGMEIRKHLEDLEIPTRIVHINMRNISERLNKEYLLLEVKRKLQNYNLGLIGEVSDWLIASHIDPISVKDIWGINLIPIPMKELLEAVNLYREEKLSESTEQFLNHSKMIDRTSKQIFEAQYVVKAIEILTKKYSLDAFSIECFSLIQETESTSCYALSYFNDIGLVAGCEGDLPSTFTMILAKLLLDKPSFMANITSINTNENTVNLAHCTVPLTMTNAYSIYSHFESNKGVAIKGEFKLNEPVTLIKIGGKSLTEWWVSSGIILKNQDDEGCCRTQVELQLNDSVDYFLHNSLANHHIMILGDHQLLFETFLKQFLQ